MHVRRLAGRLAFCALAALAVAGFADTARRTEAQSTVTIASDDDFFEPRTVTVPVGTTVVWVGRGSNGHTVTSDTGLFDSGSFPFIKRGERYQYTFTQAGRFGYFCQFHGGPGSLMAGAVIVEEAQRSTADGSSSTPITSHAGASNDDSEDGVEATEWWWYAAIAAAVAVVAAAVVAAQHRLRRR